MTEKQVQADIKKYLRTVGASVWDTSQPRAAMITPGLPDLIVVFRGRLAFVEVKTEKGKLSPAQEVFRAEVAGAGHDYQVWRSAHDAHTWCESARHGLAPPDWTP